MYQYVCIDVCVYENLLGLAGSSSAGGVIGKLVTFADNVTVKTVAKFFSPTAG